MPPYHWSPALDHEQLTRLAGEQALLQRDRNTCSQTFERDKHGIIALANSVDQAASAPWLAGGLALLERLHHNKAELARMDARIADLRKLTGL